MNYSYYLYKQGEGYLTKAGGHTESLSNALRFSSYIDALTYRFNNSLNDYQIIEMI